MRLLAPILLLCVLITSCQSEKQLLNNVSNISLHPDPKAALNSGAVFSYTVNTELLSGEEKKIRNDAFISFPDGQLLDAGQHKAQINTALKDFTSTQIPFQVALEIGEYRVVSTDSLTLNFRSPIISNWNGSDGTNGVQPRASSATLFGRDGLEGRPGGNGKPGKDGRHFTGYIWEDEAELRMVLICDSTNQYYCYRSLRKDTVVINLTGGDAGDGSMGGTGGDGKRGKPGKNPGNGADGGPGGNGGAGGNGGSLVLFLHPDIDYLDQSIHLINTGGKGGKAGIGGAPGKAGKGIKGQPKASDGIAGLAGDEGADGLNGPPLTISTVAFDYKSFER